MYSRRTFVERAIGTGITVGVTGCADSPRTRSTSVVRSTTERRSVTSAAAEGTATPRATPDRPESLTPGTYAVIAIFRNDDPQPWYEFDALKDVESAFVDANIPLTHGVIPAANGEPIRRDSSFCRHLRRQAVAHPGLFEFALHGFTHGQETEFYGKSEFGGLPAAKQRERISEGRTLLSNCLDVTPTSFIPPFNTYDDSTVAALKDTGMACVSGGAWFTSDYYGESRPPFEVDSMLHLPSSAGVVSNWETGELHDQETLRSSFDTAAENGGVLVQMLHYHSFDTDDRLAVLQSLLDYVAGRADVACTTLSGFATACADGSLERTEDGWRYDP